MIFLPSELFFLLNCFITVFHWIKYGLYRLFTPLVEKVVKYKLNKIGVKINGKNDCDIQVYRKDFYARAGTHYTLGLGEAYMDKSIDVEDVTDLTAKWARSKHWQDLEGYTFMQYFNMQTRKRAWEVGEKHYDVGNQLFELMLDSTMNYTCAYWRNANNLEEAQLAKMDLIARKLKLKPGMRVLDIGCGFGGFDKYLADNYGVHVVGCTISVEQAKYGKEHFPHPNVDVRIVDYREMNEKFDRVVSVGMFEAVGHANFTTFFKTVSKCLKDDGIFLLHTIGVCDKDFPLTFSFSHKYIFPNGILPRHTDITKYTNGLFYIEDWHNFGYDYCKTLAAWKTNFIKAWPKLKHDYDERFYRMWIFYLSSANGFFRARKMNLWQIVLTKNGLEGGYESVR